MKKYILTLLVLLPLIGNCQFKIGIESGILISGSKNQKEIIPSSAWSSFFNVGYKIKQFSILSGIGYLSYQCENKITIYKTDIFANKLYSVQHAGYYTSNYLSVPLCVEYDILKNKLITPLLGIGILNNIKVGNRFESNDNRYVENISIKSVDSFISTFTMIGLKARIGNKFAALIKSKYQYNAVSIFHSKNESLQLNGISFNIGFNYIF
jgi:hypothetical protein